MRINLKKIFSSFEKIALWKLIVVLVVIGIITYATSLLDGFVWDDTHFFLQNLFTGSVKYWPQIFISNTTAGAGSSSNYYRPIATLSFALDHLLWFGWNAAAMHFTNMIIHIINGILLFLWFVRLGMKKSFSLFISSIFLVHPIQTEAVTYLSSRGDILYTLFLFSSLYLYTYSLYKDQLVLKIKKIKIVLSYQFMLLLCVLLFPFAILSKEGALTTGPMYLGVLLYFFVQKKLTIKKLWQQYRDHLLVIGPLLFITLFYFYLRLTILNFGNTLNYADSDGLYATHLAVRLFTFLKVFLLDIGMLVAPYPLYLERDTAIVTSFFSPWVFGSLAVILGMIVCGIWEMQKRKSALIFFSLILLFSNLLSVSGIIPMTGIIRENWLYVPMIGFYTIFFVLLMWMFPYITKHTKSIIIFSILLIGVYAGMTINQNRYWKDDITYFLHNLQYTNTERLHLNLGTAYMAKREDAKAIAELQKAVAMGDSYPQTHYNLGVIYTRHGKIPLAKKEFLICIEMDSAYFFAYSPLIHLYIQDKQYDNALPLLAILTNVYPKDYNLFLIYAKVAYDAGRIDQAMTAFQQALAISGNDPRIAKLKAELKLPIDKQ